MEHTCHPSTWEVAFLLLVPGTHVRCLTTASNCNFSGSLSFPGLCGHLHSQVHIPQMHTHTNTHAYTQIHTYSHT